MARFRVENFLAMLGGIQAGKQQTKLRMQQEQQQQQQQALGVLPALLEQANRARQAQLEPLRLAYEAPNQTPESQAATLKALQAGMQQYAPVDGSQYYGQIMGGQRNLDLSRLMPQGGGAPAPVPQFRDPRAEALAEAERQRNLMLQDRTDERAYDERRDADRLAAATKAQREQAVLGSKLDSIEKFYQTYPQARERGFTPEYDYGLVQGGGPQRIQGQIPIPGAFGAKVPVDFQRPSALGGGNPGPTADMLTNEARAKRDADAAAARKEIAELRADATRFKSKQEYLQKAGDLWVRAGQNLADLPYFQQQKAAEWDALEQGQPLPGGKLGVPTSKTPQQAQAEASQARAADITDAAADRKARLRILAANQQSLAQDRTARLALDRQIRAGNLDVAKGRLALAQQAQRLRESTDQLAKDPIAAQEAGMLRTRISNLEGQINKLNFESIKSDDVSVRKQAKQQAQALVKNLDDLNQQWSALKQRVLQTAQKNAEMPSRWGREQEDLLQATIREYAVRNKRPAPASLRTQWKQMIQQGK